MTFLLVGGALATDRPVIKRDERRAFTDALDLLREAAAIRADAAAQVARAVATARTEALAEARTAIGARLAEEVAVLAAAVERHAAERRLEIADAAYAATRAIVGALPADEATERVVRRTLERMGATGRIVVEVAPAHVERVAAAVAGAEHVTVAGDPALAPTACRLRTETGQVIAGVDVQLEALAQRWGVSP